MNIRKLTIMLLAITAIFSQSRARDNANQYDKAGETSSPQYKSLHLSSQMSNYIGIYTINEDSYRNVLGLDPPLMGILIVTAHLDEAWEFTVCYKWISHFYEDEGSNTYENLKIDLKNHIIKDVENKIILKFEKNAKSEITGVNVTYNDRNPKGTYFFDKIDCSTNF